MTAIAALNDAALCSLVRESGGGSQTFEEDTEAGAGGLEGTELLGEVPGRPAIWKPDDVPVDLLAEAAVVCDTNFHEEENTHRFPGFVGFVAVLEQHRGFFDVPNTVDAPSRSVRRRTNWLPSLPLRIRTPLQSLLLQA